MVGASWIQSSGCVLWLVLLKIDSLNYERYVYF